MWPFEKQNAPCLSTSLPYSDLADGRVAGMDGSAPGKWAHTRHSARSLHQEGNIFLLLSPLLGHRRHYLVKLNSSEARLQQRNAEYGERRS